MGRALTAAAPAPAPASSARQSPWIYRPWTDLLIGCGAWSARRAGLAQRPAERNAVHLSFMASFLLLILSFQTGPSGHALILSLDLPARVTVPARAVLALSFVGASGRALVSIARRGRFGA